ncbi:MAG: hypothetical protein OEZ06_25300 [Myxococcales bacterium]|nr:hypothetical protein [Myxococcales bacterium]
MQVAALAAICGACYSSSREAKTDIGGVVDAGDAAVAVSNAGGLVRCSIEDAHITLNGPDWQWVFEETCTFGVSDTITHAGPVTYFTNDEDFQPHVYFCGGTLAGAICFTGAESEPRNCSADDARVKVMGSFRLCRITAPFITEIGGW